jgi:proteasome accessory factor B
MPRADRLFALVQLLSQSTGKTRAELMRELEASERSLYRDLADLEARGVAIERDGGRYRIMDRNLVRVGVLTARERVLLSLALENPELASQSAFRDSMRTLRSKLARTDAMGVALALSGPDRSGPVTASISNSIEQAIEARHAISILYTSLHSGRREWRAVDPWLLTHRSEAWYLIGRCHRIEEPRTFRLDRVGAVLPIGRSFERPAEFDPQRWFASSWGVEKSDESHDVHVVFDARVAPLIEYGRHHPDEVKTKRDDGGLDYRVRVGPLEELARWIVGFGGAALAVEPSELVQRVRAIAAGTVQAHAPAQKSAARQMRLRTRSRKDG